jgi:integrase
VPGKKRYRRRGEVRKRAARGSGSIYQRQDGRWAGSISLGRDETGARIRPSVVRDTPEAVAEALDELRRQHPGSHRGKPQTVADLFVRWLPLLEQQRTDATYAWYEAAWRIHIKPDPIARVPLKRLSALEIDEFYARIAKKNVGGRTRQKIHVTLHKALDVARGWNIIASNPADYAARPTHRAPKAPPFTGEHLEKLLAAARGDRYEAVYLLALFCGITDGEIFGLYRSDFDLSAGTVTVRRIASEVSGRPVLRARTKTAKRASTVLMPPIVAQAVREHLKRQMADGSADELMFPSPEGQIIRRSNFLRREYFPLLERAQLPRKRFHLLRKALGTLLAHRGVHPKAAQAMLRHESETTTLRFYTDDEAMQKVAVASIDAAFPARKRGR